MLVCASTGRSVGWHSGRCALGLGGTKPCGLGQPAGLPEVSVALAALLPTAGVATAAVVAAAVVAVVRLAPAVSSCEISCPSGGAINSGSLGCGASGLGGGSGW